MIFSYQPKVGLGGEEPVISSSHHSSDEIDNLEQHDDDFAEPHNGAITGLQQPLPSSHKMAVAMGVKAQNLQVITYYSCYRQFKMYCTPNYNARKSKITIPSY